MMSIENRNTNYQNKIFFNDGLNSISINDVIFDTEIPESKKSVDTENTRRLEHSFTHSLTHSLNKSFKQYNNRYILIDKVHFSFREFSQKH